VHVDCSNLYAVHTVGANLTTRVVTIWRQSRAKANRLLGNSPPEIPTVHEPTYHIPYDIVEMIFAHLTHNLGDLKACSLTCRSWYTAAVPHLHHTITLTGGGPDVGRSQLKPLSKLHELGLMPLVKEIRVERWPGTCCWFLPLTFSHLDLLHFSALTNVHTLKLQDMEIYRFIAGLDIHFGHFSQTLRSVTLYDPSCTPRQLSHFLSLFSNLDNVGIRNTHKDVSNTSPSNATAHNTGLVPFSAPRLGGRLALYNSPWVGTWAHLALFGGLRFRHMDLRGSTSCAPVLFKACAETLESLRLTAEDCALSKWLGVGTSVDSI